MGLVQVSDLSLSVSSINAYHGSYVIASAVVCGTFGSAIRAFGATSIPEHTDHNYR
ncbi:hypothetical protein BDR05DRAFT_957452 [Suillus weaverae]|nr:hypothetical protein BDR05DRAFT_957452 [Suillus weaverae]